MTRGIGKFFAGDGNAILNVSRSSALGVAFEIRAG
jgi:hypothetical protein